MTTPACAPADWPTTRERLVEAWWDTSGHVLAITERLTPTQAEAPTPCTDWSVRDVLAHLAAIEHELVGGARPAALVRRPGRSLLDDYTEAGVAQRRHRRPAVVHAEYAAARTARRADLVRTPPADPTAVPDHTPGGQPWNWRRVLTNRVVDTWVHELDLRVGLGLAPRWDTPAAAVFVDYAVDQIRRQTAAALRAAVADPGRGDRTSAAVPVTVVVPDVSGGPARQTEFAVPMPAALVARAGGPPSAAVQIDTDLAGFVALTTGRPALGGVVQVSGRLADAVTRRLLVVA